MKTNNPYSMINFIEVPDPNNPPQNAEPLSPENLNHMQEGIRDNRDTLFGSIRGLEFEERGRFDSSSLYPESFVSIMGVSIASGWPEDGFVVTYKPLPSSSDVSKDFQMHISRPSTPSVTRIPGKISARFCNNVSRPLRTNSTTYATNVLVEPNPRNGYQYKCVVAGTTGSSAPSNWNQSTVSDGTVTWERQANTNWSTWSDGFTNITVNGLATKGVYANSPSSLITLTSTTDITPVEMNTLIKSDSSITLTKKPTIKNGVDGQELRLVNLGSFDITFEKHTSENQTHLLLKDATKTIPPNSSLRLVYLNSIGMWLEI